MIFSKGLIIFNNDKYSIEDFKNLESFIMTDKINFTEKFQCKHYRDEDHALNFKFTRNLNYIKITKNIFLMIIFQKH